MAGSDLDDKLQNFIKEKDRAAFKSGLYTVGLLLVVGLAGVGSWAVYRLLGAFLTPIYWAALIGTVLFPLKQSVTNGLRSWLRGLRDANTPLLLGIASLPLNWLDAASHALWAIIASEKIFFVVGGWFALKFLTYKGAFYAFISLFTRAFNIIDRIIDIFSSKWALPVFLLYFCIFMAWAYLQPSEWESMKLARLLSVPIWFFCLVLFSSFCGPLRVPVLLGLAGLIAAIAAQLLLPGDDDYDGRPTEETSEGTAAEEAPSIQKWRPPTEVEEAAAESGEGDLYLRGIFAACVLLLTVRHTWLLSLFAIPLLYTILKKFTEKSGLLDKAKEALKPFHDRVHDKVHKITTLVIPVTIKKFARALFSGDQWMIEGLENSMDVLSSVVVMILMLLAIILVTLFAVFQVHSEVSHLVTVTAAVVSESSGQEGFLGSALNYTGVSLDEAALSGYVDQAYVQGRGWLATQVRALADPKDTERADMLEAQVKMVVDRIYEIYQQSSWTTAGEDDGAKMAEEAELDVWQQLTASLDVSRLSEELTRIAKENIATLQSIGETLWGLVASNAALISSMVGAVLGVLLGFGMDFLNFIIELIVFLTMVYYLLAGSREQWKPLEWLGQASGGKGGKPGAVSSAISRAVEEAISGVFTLSAKMAAFYGLYTFFVHSLFQLHIVFVPSMTAAVLAAVPLSTPCAVCVLGVVELALVKAELASALLFVVASFAPLAFADAAFYKEVRGSHPYVTGLAIVGGMYWLGAKGALIGPIILCSMLVLLKLLAALRSQ